MIYTPGEDGEGDRIAVESDQFSVQMTVGEDQIIGVTKIKGAVGDDRPCGLWDGPLHCRPRHHLGSCRLFEMLGRTVTLEGDALSIR